MIINENKTERDAVFLEAVQLLLIAISKFTDDVLNNYANTGKFGVTTNQWEDEIEEMEITVFSRSVGITDILQSALKYSMGEKRYAREFWWYLDAFAYDLPRRHADVNQIIKYASMLGSLSRDVGKLEAILDGLVTVYQQCAGHNSLK